MSKSQTTMEFKKLAVHETDRKRDVVGVSHKNLIIANPVFNSIGNKPPSKLTALPHKADAANTKSGGTRERRLLSCTR
jgi:hypothetical protein